jgi:hypothetical protein
VGPRQTDRGRDSDSAAHSYKIRCGRVQKVWAAHASGSGSSFTKSPKPPLTICCQEYHCKASICLPPSWSTICPRYFGIFRLLNQLNLLGTQVYSKLKARPRLQSAVHPGTFVSVLLASGGRCENFAPGFFLGGEKILMLNQGFLGNQGQDFQPSVALVRDRNILLRILAISDHLFKDMAQAHVFQCSHISMLLRFIAAAASLVLRCNAFSMHVGHLVRFWARSIRCNLILSNFSFLVPCTFILRM